MHPNLKKLESSLWEATDQLRAHAKRTPSEYAMPVLGLIFLRHATQRFKTQSQTISVPPKAHYEYLLSLSKYLGERIANLNPLFPYLKTIHPTDFEQYISFSHSKKREITSKFR